MTPHELADLYRAYIDCLNARAFDDLGRFVGDDVHHNGRPLGLTGYRDMLMDDFERIPDLWFRVELLVCEPPHIASRLAFDCSPKGQFLDLAVNGRRIRFAENVFYRVEAGRIVDVRSVLDKTAIEAQL
ncbi:ester cyclase [Neorhizobium sp. NPDC001467]|uniref:ester cyclase n=1 Tax=Neorhizobium sp. NPDC001467 TaxID=3390595 RepID=UPI003D018D9A